VNGEIVSESGEAHEDKSCAMGAARRIRPADADIQVEEWRQVAHLHEQPADQVKIMTATWAVNISAAEAAVELADRVATELTTGHYLAAVLVGGDGVAAILRRLAADRVVVDSMITTGCPTGTVVGGPADGLRLITNGSWSRRPGLATAPIGSWSRRPGWRVRAQSTRSSPHP
jgi:uncharacterized protein YgbK (DUF1537 family)